MQWQLISSYKLELINFLGLKNKYQHAYMNLFSFFIYIIVLKIFLNILLKFRDWKA